MFALNVIMNYTIPKIKRELKPQPVAAGKNRDYTIPKIKRELKRYSFISKIS